MRGEALAAILVLPRIDVAARRIRKQIADLRQERAVTASVVEQAPAGVRLDEFAGIPKAAAMAPGNNRAARKKLLASVMPGLNAFNQLRTLLTRSLRFDCCGNPETDSSTASKSAKAFSRRHSRTT